MLDLNINLMISNVAVKDIIATSSVYIRIIPRLSSKNLVRPSDILVTPINAVERFTSLPYGTIADMFAVVKRVCDRLCEYYDAKSSTISIQDGKDAGQSVPHVHIHVLPRKPGDFARNDDIYDALQKHDKVPDRKLRSPEEMATEAKRFRSFFYDTNGQPLIFTE
ncbi:hypothetical protein ACTXT7_001996 [Hymenolepis weldensis]